jgi:hypothetical protein
MADVNRVLIYAVADALGMPLHYDPASGDLTGDQERQVNLQGLRLTVPMTIASSRLTDDSVMVLARALGNLAVFVFARRVNHRDLVDLFALNLAKMERPESWLEKRKAKSNGEVLDALKPAIVKSYAKVGPDRWKAA